MIPSVIAEVASQIATVLADPSNKMYGKINKFLSKAPSWDAQKIISYWIDRVLLKEPEDDDGHDLEVGWLLELLVNALRTSQVSYVPLHVLHQPLWLLPVPQVACHCRIAV
jgi:nucleolar pre-ribosomal-associated protein 1